MIKPDFLVIGAMKCASSTICAYLEHHPEAFMVPGAEPHFFSRDENWAKGPEWYARFFDARTTERICGEGTNGYTAGTTYPETAGRIRDFCPEVKLVYMVRHPIDRIVSAWIQYRQNKGEFVGPDIDRAVLDRREIFVEQSAYWTQIQRYRAHFPDSQILIGFMEDLMADEKAVLRRLCAFLDINPEVPPARAQVNPSLGKEVPTAALSRLRALPGMEAAKRLAPHDLKQRIKRRFFTARLNARPTLSPAVRAELARELRDDSAALLRHAGKPADFWSLDPD